MQDTREEIGYQSSSFQEKHKKPLTEQMRSREVLLKRPPLIKPKRMPEDILGTDYDEIKEVLLSFSKSKMEWDEFARKVDPTTRDKMRRKFAECREQGFFGPRIGGDGDIKFTQMTEMSEARHEVYRVEIKDHEGNVEIKRVGKEWLRPNMKIVERIK